MKKIAIISFLIIVYINLSAQQEYKSPIRIPLFLSANFGELRPNHFHSGIDIKTENTINKPIYAIEDGYISRVSVSAGGYGLAIYVDQINGETAVYGHLNSFMPKISEYVKNKQYEQESFKIDLNIDKNIFPVKKGDLIAYSGNSGSSAGPHLHFEIRNTKSQLALDPLPYYKHLIEDSQPPLVKGIAVYPIQNKGIVNSGKTPLRFSVLKQKNGDYGIIKDSIQAWGIIGIGIHAIDRMDGTTNIFGVKAVRLYCDGNKVFSSDISSVRLDQTRMINSFVDFDYWTKKRIFYMKSFVEPGNKLPIYTTINNGYINIDEERTYNLTYELEDLYGNITVYKFPLEGRKQIIPTQEKCSQKMDWDANNYFITESFSLIIPKNNLYDNICFNFKQKKTTNQLSNQFAVHDSYVPLNGFCEIKIRLNKDTLVNKNQYGIVRINGKNESWLGGTYSNGSISSKIRELGHNYAIAIDNQAPVITPVKPKKWVSDRKIKVKISDNKSGIKSYRGTIDGNYVLFVNDIKSSVYSYSFDPKRFIQSDQMHKFELTVVDQCGNTTYYEYEFKY